MWNKFIVGVFKFIYYELRNKQGFSDSHHLSSVQQNHTKLQTNVHCYLQLKLLGKQQKFGQVTLDR